MVIGLDVAVLSVVPQRTLKPVKVVTRHPKDRVITVCTIFGFSIAVHFVKLKQPDTKELKDRPITNEVWVSQLGSLVTKVPVVPRVIVNTTIQKEQEPLLPSSVTTVITTEVRAVFTFSIQLQNRGH